MTSEKHDPATDSWPPLSYEGQLWTPTGQQVWGVNHAQRAAPQKYRSAISPEIAHLTPTPQASTSFLAAEAERELTRLDTELGDKIKNFAPVLLRSEAASSSQIENLTASARAIFSAELGLKKSSNAELITANTESLQAAIRLSNEMSATAVK